MGARRRVVREAPLQVWCVGWDYHPHPFDKLRTGLTLHNRGGRDSKEGSDDYEI